MPDSLSSKSWRIDDEPTLRGTPAEIADRLIADMGTFDDEPLPWPYQEDEDDD